MVLKALVQATGPKPIEAMVRGRRPAPMPDGAGFCTSGCSARRQSAGWGELTRTAALLLLKDSRSSFEIEGEHPPQARIQR